METFHSTIFTVAVKAENDPEWRGFPWFHKDSGKLLHPDFRDLHVSPHISFIDDKTWGYIHRP